MCNLGAVDTRASALGNRDLCEVGAPWRRDAERATRNGGKGKGEERLGIVAQYTGLRKRFVCAVFGWEPLHLYACIGERLTRVGIVNRGANRCRGRS
jgi:hypothetical protein